MKKFICLRGLNGDIEGQLWESIGLLRAGRLESLEIVLNDSSVSRRHAEIRATENGWHLRDLGSTNGTFLNGIRLGAGERKLRPRDLIQFGKVTLIVDKLEEGQEEFPTDQPMMVEATARSSWDEALENLAFDINRAPRVGEKLLTLLRASHHLGRLENEEELLQSILNDAVVALDAQRGAIVLSEGPAEELRLRALATGGKESADRHNFSQNLATRCFNRGESVLCRSVVDDPELATAKSVHDGAMSSVICALLRTPRKRLGVLHLDRSYWQTPFSPDDLHLADALAASVSAGIESCQLLRHQRDLFLNTITALAQAVETRDPYTGRHTVQVRNYALLLGMEMNLGPEDQDRIRTGTPLHDIGKIGIDDAILRKPGRLSAEEYEIMKSHTTKGVDILVNVPDLEPILPIVRSHHERWDGHGYPQGLVGEEIPLLARIVTVADAFDAMTTDRSYRKRMPPEVAFAELENQSGRQFDPNCVAAFLRIQDKILKEMEVHEAQGGADKLQETNLCTST